jgi:pimeloyl-ACP methyl ester carboxylesterase
MIAEDKMAAEDRSVFAGDARLELVAKLPSNAKLVEIDAGHTIHRDRFDDYMAAILDWLDTGTTGQEGEGAR